MRVAAFILACVACGSCAGSAVPPLSGAAQSDARLHGSRWAWVDASCSDGALELGSVGLERVLTIEVAQGGLRLTHDSVLATEGCRALSVWSAVPSDADLWRFQPEASVITPSDAECGPEEPEPTLGNLRLQGELLEIVTRRSPWCRGLDARFVYRRTAPERLSAEQLAERYVAHWNRADASAIAQLFEARGSLVEPFTRTPDGSYARHEGREAVRTWHARAFSSASWHAMKLIAVEPLGVDGQWALGFEYMDDRLAEPLRGRNLFVVAGGEIYQAELQLLSDPKPAGGSSSAPQAPEAVL